MRNKENIDHIVRDKRAKTSLSLSRKISAFCYCNSTECLFFLFSKKVQILKTVQI